MTARNTDYDAAQALLDLQGPVKQDHLGPYMWRASNSREDMENTAKLFWNCFISSEIPMVSVSTSNNHETTTKLQEKSNEFPNTSKSFENVTSKSRLVSRYNVSKHYRNYDKNCSTREDSPTLIKSSPKMPLNLDIPNNYNTKNITKTKEMSTQTEGRDFNPNIEFMENTIKNLFERIQSLEAQLKQSLPEQNSALITSENETEDNQSYENPPSTDGNMSLDENNVNGSKTVKYSNRLQFDDSNELIQDRSNEFTSKIKTNHSSHPKANDVVPIGDGHAAVPARLLKHINWNSYTSATRKLLTAVFSRRILATHSLTGRPSPAFPNKPAKKRLDPSLVNDIVQTVVERCSVPENVVRTSITTKCADESKMFKTRQSNKKRRTSKKNCENVPPQTSESESGDY